MSIDISELLSVVVERNASDLHLTVDKPPVLRVDGRLDVLDFKPLTAEDTMELMKSITSVAHQQKIQERGGTDFGFAFGDLARFRVSVYKQKGNIGLALRLIPSKLLTFEELGLSPTIKELLYKPKGLILVTGPTGCGKTTTLATMLDFINQERDCHIITVEDPIEYYHKHKKSVVTQRELGVDVPSFAEAIVKALRQDPDVILVGEMRDLATMEAAITAAETGHLVFATLHTTGAARTMDRIIDAFPMEQQEQIRAQLSVSILAVISQMLLPKDGGRGRVAAFEVMIATPAVQNLIREKKAYNLPSVIETGAKYGMKTLDQSLYELHSNGLISYEEAMNRAYDAAALQAKLGYT
ncbi:MAG: type IV pilus twitching motility protein PilT [Nitrospirae bacterium]|nr:type IV pilus twitching motility protein PilT [Nitrospirota bacterium]